MIPPLLGFCLIKTLLTKGKNDAKIMILNIKEKIMAIIFKILAKNK